MRIGGFRRAYPLVVLLLAVYLTFIPSNEKSKAVDTNAWAGGAVATDLGTLIGLNNAGNLECQYTTLKSRYVSSSSIIGGKTVYNSNTTEGEGRTYGDTCTTQNSHGLMSASGLWSKDLDINNVMPIDSGRYSMVPSPGGTAVVFYDIAPNYGYQYSINHNIGYIGNVSTKKYGTGVSAKYEKVWKIDTSKLDSFLLYGTPENGTIARFDQIGFSSNGRYAVVLLSKRGFARLDLQTKELTPFYNVNYNNGVGVSMTISNDGRYAATAKNLSSNFMVHDLLGCQSVYKYGTWEATGVLQTSGCASTNLFSSVQQVFPTANSISGLRFSPNGGLLDIFVRYSDSTGNPTNKARLSAIGYESSASGYLAMGDSFSSGEGDLDGGNWYEPGTDEQGDIGTFNGRNLCHLSRRSYPYLMAVELGFLTTNSSRPPENGNFHSVACSGAKIHNIMGVLGEKQDAGTSVDFAVTDNQYRYDGGYLLEEWQPGYERQVGFMLGRKDKLITERNAFYPEVITVSIGGNDAGFGQKLLS
ncbi:MAG: hypothetical protein Q7T41_01525, partial [Candidatus Saccharibacteria bacterium]|nr:hypothetical protein [Candidatus Saccharibacteria bacterium]